MANPSATPPVCSSSYNPYYYTASAVRACGVTTSTSAVTTQLAGGGTRTEYSLPGQQGVTTLYEPPAGFDPATATAAQLNEYGLPTPPVTDGIAAVSEWQAVMSKMKSWTPNPPFLVEGQASAATASTLNSGNWSGYIAFKTQTSGPFTSSLASWGEPNYYPSQCSSNSAVDWTGIGGYGSGEPLGQDGTAWQSGNDHTGANNHQAWEEVLPQQPSLVPLPLQTSAGDIVSAIVNWDAATGSYSGVVADNTTGQAKPWSHGGNWIGDSGEAITERPSYNGQLRDLSNYATMNYFSAAENFESMNQFSAQGQRAGLWMWGAVNPNTGQPEPGALKMADVTDVSTNGAFSDTQHSCVPF